jgi:hypothetical protein
MMAIAAALCLLALLDGALCGFRAAAGRSGLVRKRAYYLRAVGRGFLAVALTLVPLIALTALLLSRSPQLEADFAAAGRAALFVYGPYATLVLCALALWAIPALDVRTLATVIILGPFTMLRPLVVAAGLVAAAFARPRLEVTLLVVCVGALMLSIERLLGRAYRVDSSLYG